MLTVAFATPIDREAVNQRLELVTERLARESVAGQQYLIALQSTP